MKKLTKDQAYKAIKFAQERKMRAEEESKASIDFWEKEINHAIQVYNHLVDDEVEIYHKKIIENKKEIKC